MSLAYRCQTQTLEAGVTRTAPSTQPVQGNIRHGFVYERVPHITLKSIANNAEIDVIWDPFTDSLARRICDEQNAVKTTAFALQLSESRSLATP